MPTLFRDLKAGDIVRVDNGFLCMPGGLYQLQKDKDGHLYIKCNQGTHYLDALVRSDGTMIGIEKKE